jgi:hypothetical protein
VHGQCASRKFGPQARDQKVFPDADQHVSLEKKADAAEHSLFFNLTLASQPLAYPLDEGLMARHKNQPVWYFFIDIDLRTRQLVGWGTETKDKVEVRLTRGYHRVFLTRGQYNKLVSQLRVG